MKEIDFLMVASKVKKARAYKGLTQQQLAEACGYSIAQIGNTERGKSTSLRLLHRIALALDVSLDYLLDMPKPLDKDESEWSRLEKLYTSATPQMRSILAEDFTALHHNLTKNLGADG